MTPSDKQITIEGQSRVSVALLGGIFTVLVGATWGAASWATRVETRLENIERDINRGTADRWTKSEMRSWSLELKRDNPDIKTPDIQAGGGY